MAAFRWQTPERFNMGADVADRHASALALIEIEPSGKTRELTFDAISALSKQVGSSSRGSWTDKNSSVHPQLPDGLLEAARGGRRTGRAGRSRRR